ncbi:MAG: cellulase family glycosylhydrolase [Nostocales cyanobacterium 94392]|nr:cellulase family glycosylhydrolase [Nostocales cyanobacterium 94392]
MRKFVSTLIIVIFVQFLLFVSQITLFHPTVAQQNSGKLYGVHEFNIAKQTARNLPERISLTQQVGAKVIRLPISWHLLEGTKGVTPNWFWDELDADIKAAEQAGLKVIIELGQTPCWASSAPDKQRCSDPNYTDYLLYPPTNYNDYANAIAKLVQRYRSRVYAWEIWNEPNLKGNWQPLGSRPSAINDFHNSFINLQGASQYANLVKASYNKIKSVDRNAFVLAGAIAAGDVDYVNEMYKAGIKGYFDALSIHPYTGTYPVGRTDPKHSRSYGPDECPTGVEPAKLWCFKVGVERIRQAMQKQNDNKPIWFTEFGFSSTEGWNPNSSGSDREIGWNGSGLNGQAEHLRKAVELINNWSYVPVACWYQLVDRYARNDREGRFGLFDVNGKIKPSGQAFKQLMNTTKPVPISPKGEITTNPPVFSWQAVPGATSYKLWVNEYSSPNVPGKINRDFTPTQANCASSNTCRVSPRVRFAQASAEWWVTANFSNGSSQISDSARFVVK